MPSVYRYEEGGSTPQGPDLVLPKDSAGEVLRTEDGREYVVYENPTTGEKVKVFGVWNEAPGIKMGSGGPRTQVINTEFKYPIMQSENGEFVLDESQLDVSQEEDGPKMVYDPRLGRKMPVAPTKNLLRQLSQQGPGYSGEDKLSPTVRRGIDMEFGGKTFRYNER